MVADCINPIPGSRTIGGSEFLSGLGFLIRNKSSRELKELSKPGEDGRLVNPVDGLISSLNTNDRLIVQGTFGPALESALINLEQRAVPGEKNNRILGQTREALANYEAVAEALRLGLNPEDNIRIADLIEQVRPLTIDEQTRKEAQRRVEEWYRNRPDLSAAQLLFEAGDYSRMYQQHARSALSEARTAQSPRERENLEQTARRCFELDRLYAQEQLNLYGRQLAEQRAVAETSTRAVAEALSPELNANPNAFILISPEGERTESQPRVIGGSIRGASHETPSQPNQDSINCVYTPHGDLIMAVADGHGSSEHFRSDQGSEFATEVATQIGKNIAESIEDANGNIGELDRFKAWYREALVDSWRYKVARDIREDPFEGGPRDERSGIEAYGSTILSAVLIPGRYLILAQLGDGDILMSSARDRKATLPMPVDPKLFGRFTTSLCQENPEQDFRVEVIKLDPKKPPPCVMLATDGLNNSFNKRGDPRVLADRFLGMRNLTDQQLLQRLPGSMSSWTRYANGNGDDITIALLRPPAA